MESVNTMGAENAESRIRGSPATPLRGLGFDDSTSWTRPSKRLCCRDVPDAVCQCEHVQFMCRKSLWERVCLAPQPVPHAFRNRMRELLQRRPKVEPAACKWHDVEILLKAAISSDERQLLMEWVLSYIRNMECFPRLHVVSDRPENSSSFRGLLRRVPNVTFHTLSYPFEMDEFWAMQWPMLWACLLYTSPSPRDATLSRMPSSA